MFNGHQYYQTIQQDRSFALNMGNSFFPNSPYHIPSQYQTGNYPHQQMIQAFHPSMYNGWNYQQSNFQNPYHTLPLGGKKTVQSIFQNPLEPQNPYPQQSQMNNHYMNYNPYPKMNMVPRPNGGLGSIMNSFKGQDGSFDLNKMVNTAGQMMNAVSQVSAMVKGIGSMFKV